MAARATLGRTLLGALDDLNKLIPAATDAELPALQDQRRLLIAQISRLVDANLDQATQDYAAATTALQAASDSIRRAAARLEKVAFAIEKLGQALQLVAKVAGA
jgi:VIT1/CCC1 family predicted Fe2+/Mn2+ transporter